MSLISSWGLIRGWEAFHRLRPTRPEALKRPLRQPRHVLTLAGMRVAPVRPVGELGTSLDFSVAPKAPVPFSRLEPELRAQGWSIERAGLPGFAQAFTA